MKIDREKHPRGSPIIDIAGYRERRTVRRVAAYALVLFAAGVIIVRVQETADMLDTLIHKAHALLPAEDTDAE